MRKCLHIYNQQNNQDSADRTRNRYFRSKAPSDISSRHGRALATAYHWPADIKDEEILERLVALNRERAEEERRGLIRYLRPAIKKQKRQNPTGTTQQTLATSGDEEEEQPAAPTKPAKIKKQPWPKTLSEQASAVQAALTQHAAPADETDLAKHFTRANKERIGELLETLASLGRARELGMGGMWGCEDMRTTRQQSLDIHKYTV